MKTSRSIFAVTLLSALSFSNYEMLGQDFTEKENEVWETVKAYTQKSHERDFEGYIAYFHPDFEGWHLGAWENPTDYDTRTEGLKHFFAATESISYSLVPHSVRVFGDVAIVQYTNNTITKSIKSGEEQHGVSKWTDILKKEEGRWLLIGDHGD